jgi:hypothetical protein
MDDNFLIRTVFYLNHPSHIAGIRDFKVLSSDFEALAHQ